MNQYSKIERIDPETGEVTEVSLPTSEPTAQAEAPAAEVSSKAPAVKRTFPLQPILAEKVPPLPTPAADRIDPDWDIAKVATRGAVHLERFFVMSEKMFWPSILVVVLAFSLIFHAMPISSGFASGYGRGEEGMIRLMMLLLPFFIIGVALTAGVLSYLDQKLDEGLLLVGGLFFGIPLALLWHGAGADPNSPFAWVLFVTKVSIGVGLVIWIASHIRKIQRSGESRMVLWMAGTYVGIVVIASVALASLGAALSGLGPSGLRAVSAMLTFDRDSYFDLGGGLRSGPEYRWMSQHAPNSGLSQAKFNSLIASVRSDYAKHSKDAGSWEEVTKLDPQPMITRPEKAIRDNAKELPNGIVVIPEGRDPVSIVAHVEGQWSITIVASSDCTVVLGPFDPKSGCQNATTPAQPINGYASRILDTIKPTPSASEVKE